MPSPHAGFAAVTIISETTINQVLDTYLNTFLDGFNVTIQRSAPAVISGSALSFNIKAKGVMLSLWATLKKNPSSLISFTARFYSLTQVDVMRTGLNYTTRNLQSGSHDRCHVDNWFDLDCKRI